MSDYKVGKGFLPVCERKYFLVRVWEDGSRDIVGEAYTIHELRVMAKKEWGDDEKLEIMQTLISGIGGEL